MKEVFEAMQRAGFIPEDRMYHLLSPHELSAFNKAVEEGSPIRTLEEQVEALEEAVGDFEEEVRSLEWRVADLEDEKEALEQEVEDLKGELK